MHGNTMQRIATRRGTLKRKNTCITMQCASTRGVMHRNTRACHMRRQDTQRPCAMCNSLPCTTTPSDIRRDTSCHASSRCHNVRHTTTRTMLRNEVVHLAESESSMRLISDAFPCKRQNFEVEQRTNEANGTMSIAQTSHFEWM